MDQASKTIALIAFLSLTPQLALSDGTSVSDDPCASPVDLRAPGMSMEHVPVLDQDDLNLCFAYAASQMVDAYVHSHSTPGQDGSSANPNFQTSAIAAALDYSENHSLARWMHNPVTRGGGYPCDVINQIRKKGSCDENALEGSSYLAHDLMLAVYQEFDQYKKVQSQLYELEHPVGDENSDKTVGQLAHEKTDLQHKEEAYFTDVCDLMEATMWPNGLEPSLQAIKKLVQQSNSVELVRETVLATCDLPEHREKPDLPACQNSTLFKESAAYRKINELLSRPNAQPVGISFCAQVLIDGKKTGFWTKLFTGKNCGPHESLVIGRREVGGKCQFLVRNSWGTDCTPYSYDWDCDNGNIWIDADVLDTAVWDISTLDKSGS